MTDVVRVSVLRCAADHFETLRQMMVDADSVLAPGIRAMNGFVHFYAGADEATLSLINVSVWRTLEDARQLDRYQPMLDLGKVFVANGAVFERPIMNHASLWEAVPARA